MNVRYHSETVGYGLQGRTLLDLAFNGDHNILDGVTTRLFLEAMISALEDRTEEGLEKLR